MSTLTLANPKRRIVTTVLLIALVMWAVPAVFADNGHIGSKPPNADGDGIPNNADPDFAYGSRNGEQNFNGDAPHGSDPASDGGDGIPNGGPIEGEGHKGKGTLVASFVSSILSLLSFR